MKIYLYFLLITGSSVLIGGDDCKVLLEALNKTYEGECKKGLAHGQGKAAGKEDQYEGSFKKGLPHGKGRYEWGNGNVYTGEFLKGRMHGQGELRIVRTKLPDSTATGYFGDNEYMGKFKEPFKVLSQQGIRKIDFQEKSGQISQVAFMVYADGKQINPPLSIRDLNNTVIQNIGGNTTLTNIVYPLKQVEVSFTVSSFTYRLVFDLYKSGNWNVVISI